MSKITLLIAFIISHFFAGLEAVGTYLLWAGLVAISVLAYVYVVIRQNTWDAGSAPGRTLSDM